MKRVLSWGVWTLLFWFGTLTVGGMLVGGLAGAGAPDPATAKELGSKAGSDFGARYAGLILAASIAVSTAGTMGRVLPGTKSD